MTFPCILCSSQLTPTEIQTCAACVSEVRRDLVGIEAGFALLPSMLGQPAPVSFGTVMGLAAEEAIPDALVMLAPGAEHGEGRADDPPAVAFELWQWRQDWAEIRGEESSHDQQWERQLGVLQPPERVCRLEAAPLASNGHSVSGLVAWLGTRLHWAASYHPAFDEFVADMQRIRARLQSVTGTSEAPEHGASCPYCGVDLIRKWRERKHHRGCVGHPDRCPYPLDPDHGCADEGGFDEDWLCPRCHKAFNEAQYRFAIAMTRAAYDEAQAAEA